MIVDFLLLEGRMTAAYKFRLNSRLIIAVRNRIKFRLVPYPNAQFKRV